MTSVFEKIRAAIEGAILPPPPPPPPGNDPDEDDDDSSIENDSPTPVRSKKSAKVDNKWRRKDIGNTGIRMEFKHREDAELVDRCSVKRMSMEDRHDQLAALVSEKDEFLASDVFVIEDDRELQFHEEVKISVKLEKKISKMHKVKVKMLRAGEWSNDMAELQNREARFNTTRLEQFVIIGDLVRVKVKIKPEGEKVKVAEDSGIEVNIPSGAVDSDMDVDLKIIPPDSRAVEKYLEKDSPLCKVITEVTECLHIDVPPSFEFNQPLTLSLPFADRSRDAEEHVELVVFRMCGGDIEIVESSLNVGLTEDRVCSLQVAKFSGYFAGHVRAEQSGDRVSIIREARLLFGNTYIATILTFVERDKLVSGFPRIWIELVDKVNVRDAALDRVQHRGLIEFPNSRSPDVIVSDGYRLQIEIVGNLQGLRGIPKGHYFITYLDVAEDNHRLISVEERKNFEHQIGIINFYDKGETVVHSLQFDTVDGFVPGYPGTRRYTSSSVSSEDDLYTLNSFSEGGTTDSIGSATSLLREPRVKALQEASLLILAELVAGSGRELAIRLGMPYPYGKASQSSLGSIESMYKTLELWVRRQPTEELAVASLSQCLKQANLKSAAKAFDDAVKKDAHLQAHPSRNNVLKATY